MNFEHLYDAKGDIAEQLEEGVYLEKLNAYPASLDVIEDEDFIYGDIEQGREGWFYEPAPTRNLIAWDIILAKQIAGREAEEQEIYSRLEKLTYFNEECGCSLGDFEKLLASQGFIMEQYDGLSMRETMELLETEGRLLCAVNTGIITDHIDAKLRGLMADCMVEVIGMDISNPENIRIYYNILTEKDGCGKSCRWDSFQNAWKTSSRYALFVYKGK